MYPYGLEINQKSEIMAKENMNIQGETAIEPTKPSEVDMPEASEKNETSENSNLLLDVINEFDKIAGGKGEITSIPEELTPSITLMIDRIKTILSIVNDPLYNDMMDDLHEQKMNGETPSVLVAIARNVPIEELQRVADEEGYEDVQNAVNDRVSKEKEDEEAEKTLYGNFDQSKKNIDDYCTECGYDEARKQKLYGTIAMLRNAFADGLISKEEAAKIDKIDNYDSDVETLKSQAAPAGGIKTVLPDKASIDESMTPKKAPAPTSQTSIQSTTNLSTPDYLNTGRKRFEQQSKRG